MATASTAKMEAGILEEKIRAKTARVGVIGRGYVGLPLAVEFARAGFHVTSIDISEYRVARIVRGHSYVRDVASATLMINSETYDPR